MVFLVDTCGAGTATGRQPISELDGERGVWSLGASISSSPTERGRFSGWVAKALDALFFTDFALNVESIGFTRFVRAVIAEVKADTTWRMSLGFSVEQGDGEWPFLPNPLTAERTPEQIQLQRRSLGFVPGEDLGDLATQVAAGKEISDSLYFIDRASGRGLISADDKTGFFSGRAAELKRYHAWLAGDSPLLTVTGAAGAGKSGLLGLVVCAAAPKLRRGVREVWESAAHDLPEVPDIVALHARQRSVQQVIDIIVEQTGLEPPKDEENPEDQARERETGSSDPVQWTGGLLRMALAQERKQRLIVVDAVDESTDPPAVLRLISGLLAPERRDGTLAKAPCRVLLGGRREVVAGLSCTEELAEIAADQIDLDTADPDALEEDVRHYIARLLRASKPYAIGTTSEFVGTLAKRGANGIVRHLRPDSLWGPFLLAGLYVHYLVTLKYPPQDETAARAYAREASADLPDLMEAVLLARHDEFPSLRAVLSILARSQGDGMPLTTLRRCLKAMDADDITDKKFLATLREASPFLRTGVDPESDVALYRIFHQGLADYLHDHPASSDAVDAAQNLALERRLLAEIIGPFTTGAAESCDNWYSAEPYVLRHALGHVAAADAAESAELLLTDPYFLIRFDPRQDHRAIDMARSEQAEEYVRLLSASWSAHARIRRASDRASVCAFDAHRLNLPKRRKQFARIAGMVAFQPEEAHSLLWAEGGQVDASTPFIERMSPAMHGVAFSPDGGLLAAATTQGVHVVETDTWHGIAPLFGNSHASITAIAFSPDGRLLAFGTNAWTRSIQFWDVEKRTLVGEPWHHVTGRVSALAFSPDGRRLAIGRHDLGASVWDVTGEHPVEEVSLQHSEGVDDVQFSPDGELLAVGGGRGLAVWTTHDWNRVSLSTETARAVAFSPDGRLLAALDSEGIGLWSCETLEWIRRVGQKTMVVGGGLSFSSDGALLAIGSWTSLDVVEVSSGHMVSQLADKSTYNVSVAFHPSNPSLLISGDGEGRLRLWTGLGEGNQAPKLTQFATSSAVGSPDGRLIAIVNRNKGRLELRDPATGETLAEVPGRSGSHFHFSPDSRLLIASSYSGSLQILRTGSLPLPPAENLRIGGHPHALHRLAFSPDSKWFALSVVEPSQTTVIKIWASHGLRLIRRIPLPDQPDTFGFAGPGKLFVTINGALAVYDCGETESEETPA
ncbi:NACHT and WD repeat domain-containing protein [Streptomyces sp. NPDC048357]|uniref:NACHT and WD repeat domain-containing protein n=1 Tax=Streptomyces sp. NPDC048357 TaxID=3154719 RepID=UPI00341DF8A4